MIQSQHIHVGFCGAGIGGLAAAIALRHAGAEVTVLEAASQLGEIGAGIQMTPNVSRILIKYGVASVIGHNLVELEELNVRRRDGTKVGYTKIKPNIQRDLGYPWWVVHRAHLHEGLVKVAEKLGATLLVNSRVNKIEYTIGDKVSVTTASGSTHTFDLLVGSDGANSTVRKHLHPTVKPAPPTTNCAYRAIVPYDQVRNDPLTKDLFQKWTMEAWMSDKAYIISYPIAAGQDLNVVLSHHLDRYVDTVEDINIEDLRKEYETFDPRIKRVVDIIPGAQRWPLLVTPCLNSWSSPKKNVVLMGDAAHSMTNHMAQGAATSIEDGAFLARCIFHVVHNRLSLPQAIGIYEKARMPKAFFKQQISFLNGVIWHLPDGPSQQARDDAMKPELSGEQFLRSSNLFGDPSTVVSVYGYDAEAHADSAIFEFVKGRSPMDEGKEITKDIADSYMGWFLPEGYQGRQIDIRSNL